MALSTHRALRIITIRMNWPEDPRYESTQSVKIEVQSKESIIKDRRADMRDEEKKTDSEMSQVTLNALAFPFM